MSDKTIVVRKSASELTEAEIERFSTAWRLLAKSGDLGSIAEEHCDQETHQNHGMQTLADGSVKWLGYPGTQRFLAWHRAYLMVIEEALRDVLRRHYESEGVDPASADGLFIPYWDGTHEREIPGWIEALAPSGELSGVYVTHMQEELTNPYHASYGTAIGSKYEVRINRWPGTSTFSPASPRHVADILAEETFDAFTARLEYAPRPLGALDRDGVAPRLRALAERIGERGEALAVLSEGLSGKGWSRSQWPAAMEAIGLLRSRWLARRRAGEGDPEELGALLKALSNYLTLAPHPGFHHFVAGEDAAQAYLMGTCQYFQETVVDPMFSLLHCEIDRIWYTWETTHEGKPELEDPYTTFKPWKGSERTWHVDELVNHDALPYGYAALYTP